MKTPLTRETVELRSRRMNRCYASMVRVSGPLGNVYIWRFEPPEDRRWVGAVVFDDADPSVPNFCAPDEVFDAMTDKGVWGPELFNNLEELYIAWWGLEGVQIVPPRTHEDEGSLSSRTGRNQL